MQGTLTERLASREKGAVQEQGCLKDPFCISARKTFIYLIYIFIEVIVISVQ
jgi:hypothetical protein